MKPCSEFGLNSHQFMYNVLSLYAGAFETGRFEGTDEYGSSI
jgi:hypothetical protein